MSDLTDFLLARIAVDEQIANDNHIWNCPADPDYKGSSERICECAQRRVLRDLAAKRRIVEHYLDMTQDEEMAEAMFAEAHQVHHVMTWLAEVYSDHPDYQPEWVE